tara:strand:+ start:16933 stop:20175 length:3243 start_codon:yes stop_codon:yes gene_type:complete
MTLPAVLPGVPPVVVVGENTVEAARQAAIATSAAEAATAIITDGAGAFVALTGSMTAAQVKTALQDAITASAGKELRIVGTGSFTTNSGITLPDNTYLNITPSVEIVKASGQSSPIFVNAGCAGATTNSNIRIYGGGTITGNGGAASFSRAGVIGEIALIGVNGGFVRNIKLKNMQRGVQHSGNDFEIEDISTVSTASIPITLHGPSERQKVRRIVHAGSNEAVLLAACGLASAVPVVGNITNFVIDTVTSSGATGGGVRIAVGTRSSVRGDVKVGNVRNISGVAGGTSGVQSGFASGTDITAVGIVDDILVDGVYVKGINGNKAMLLNAAHGSLVARNIQPHPESTNGDIVNVGTAGSVTGSLSVEFRGSSAAASTRAVLVQGPVEELRVSGDLDFSSAANDDGAVVIPGNAGAYVKTLIFEGYRQTLGGSLFTKQLNSAAQATDVYLSDSKIAGGKRAFFIVGSAANIRASNTAYAGLTVNFVRADNSAVTAREINTSTTYSGGTESALVNGGTFTRIAPTSGSELTIANPANAAVEFQAALTAANAAGGGVVRCFQPGTMTITGTLLIYSNTTLELGPATVMQKASGQTGNPTMIRNANLPNFASYALGDQDISIIGGIWDGRPTATYGAGANNDGGGFGSIPAGCTGNILLAGVLRPTVKGVGFRTARTAAVQIVGDHILVEDVKTVDGLKYSFDFVHINGPSRFVTVRDVKGWTNDDIVAINAWDWRKAGPCVGDIQDVTVEGIAFLAPEVNTNGQQGIRLLSGTRDGAVANVKRVAIRGLSGMVSSIGAVHTHPTTDPDDGGANTNIPTGGKIVDVTIRDINRVRLFNGASLLYIAQQCQNWNVDGATLNDNTISNAIVVTADGSVNDLTVRRLIGDADAGVERYIDVKGPVGRLVLDGCRWRGKNSGGATSGSSATAFLTMSGAAGWIDEIVVNDHQQTYGETFIYAETTTTASTPCRVKISSSKLELLKRAFWLRRGNFKIALADTDFVNLPNDLVRCDGAAASASVEVTEHGCTLTGAAAPYTNVSSAAMIRHDGTGFVVPTASITAPVNGDMVRTATGRSLYKSGSWSAL